MRTNFLLSIIFTSNLVFSQTPNNISTPIKVTIKGYSRDYLAIAIDKKKRPWRQTSKVEFWFNDNGLIQQSIFWGKHHNANLRLLNKITQHTYDTNDLRINSQEWENSYFDSLTLSFKTVFTYDSHKRLLKKELFSPNEKIPFSATEYTYYNSKKESLYTTSSGKTKYVYEYDSLGQLKHIKQLYGANLDKLNWTETYFYHIDTIIYITNVFNGDSTIKYSKQNITIYNLNKQKIINIEDYLPPEKTFPDKTEFDYDKDGLILSEKKFRKLSFQSDYIQTYIIKYSYKRLRKINSESIENINQTLLNLDSGE